MDRIIEVLIVLGAMVGYAVIFGFVVAWLEARAIRRRKQADLEGKSRQ